VWGITSACEVACQEFRRRGCSMLRSWPSPFAVVPALRLSVQLAANGRPHQIAAFTCLAVFFSDAPISAKKAQRSIE
jgi:hypothetical protein